MSQPNYAHGFDVMLQAHMLPLPLRWTKPQTIFASSMSDLFNEDVRRQWIDRVFQVMRQAHWHRFQVLTKRADRLGRLSGSLPWAPNIWMGVGVENAAYRERIEHLRASRAGIKFLSLEPLLGPLPDLDLGAIDWVIGGGESGPGARPMNPDWVTDLRDQCRAANVPCFFKQWGGRNKKKAGRELEGRTWNEMPLIAY
jgi:protein gp37